MKVNQYFTFPLEDWVTNLYLRMGIMNPKQINITRIARHFRIFIHLKPMRSHYEIMGRYKGIIIDSRKPIEQHREIFFHELCHILRHSGKQNTLPAAFRELQEWDAQHFVKYAAIPFHMLKFINFDDIHILEQMTGTFKVSHELCLERLLQLQRNGYFHGQNVPGNLYICD